MNLRPDDEGFAEDLDRGLRSLPVATAGVEFRAGVLARAASVAANRRRLRRRLSVAAALVGLLATGGSAWLQGMARERAARRAALGEEHRRLEAELAALRELALRRSQIHLGGDAGTDLYIDLASVQESSSSAPTSTEKPHTRSLG